MNERAQFILKYAIREAETIGYDRLTRAAVAKRAGVSEALVSAYFGTMADLRDRVVTEAVETQNLVIIGQALARRHLSVSGLDPAVRSAALAAL